MTRLLQKPRDYRASDLLRVKTDKATFTETTSTTATTTTYCPLTPAHTIHSSERKIVIKRLKAAGPY